MYIIIMYITIKKIKSYKNLNLNEFNLQFF